MTSNQVIVAGDAHFHIYPCFDPPAAISILIRNLERAAGAANAGAPGREIFKIAFLAESKQNNYFQKILKNEISFKALDLEAAAGPGEHCVSLRKQGKHKLCLVAGRQIVTGEKLEILALGMEEIVPDGLPADKVIEKIIAADGLPVLAFSPGKWLFKRGQLAMALVEKYGGGKLLVGDSALRPLGWGAPAIMRRAKGAILPGSDPLPLPGEEKYAGCYGFIYRGSFDPARPLAAIKEIIADSPAEIMPAGRRCSPLNVFGRLLRLRRSGKNKEYL